MATKEELKDAIQKNREMEQTNLALAASAEAVGDKRLAASFKSIAAQYARKAEDFEWELRELEGKS